MGREFLLAWRPVRCAVLGSSPKKKRIYLVADFDSRSAGKILFESEGVSGYTPQGFRSWQGTAGGGEKSPGAVKPVLNDHGGSRMDVTNDFTATLRAESRHPPLVFENHSQDTRYKGP